MRVPPEGEAGRTQKTPHPFWGGGFLFVQSQSQAYDMRARQPGHSNLWRAICPPTHFADPSLAHQVSAHTVVTVNGHPRHCATRRLTIGPRAYPWMNFSTAATRSSFLSMVTPFGARNPSG